MSKRGLRVMFYDASENKPIGWTWKVGAILYRLFGWFDAVRGVHSWMEALAWLEAVSRKKTIDDLRFWGHGNWGRAYVNGAAITHHAVDKPDSRYRWLLDRLRPRFHKDSLIWFRTCSTAGNVMGHAFVKAWSNFFGCRVAGQTFNIGYWHSGCSSVLPGQDPHWCVDEGVTVVDGKRKTTWASRKAPRTIRFWQRKLKKGW